MKRAFIILLLLSVFILSGASAEVETIKFLDIDWYSTPEEFESGLSNKNLNYRRRNVYSSDYWSRFAGMPDEPPYLYNLDIPSQTYSYESSNNKDRHYEILINVAGYKVYNISAKFKASYSLEKMKIGKPFRLARAEYEILASTLPKEISIDEAYDDLKNKLSSIYGDPAGYREKERYSTDQRRTTWWFAKDGTGVSLRIQSISSNKIIIEYGLADEEDYLNDIYTIRQFEKQEIEEELSNNINGL